MPAARALGGDKPGTAFAEHLPLTVGLTANRVVTKDEAHGKDVPTGKLHVVASARHEVDGRIRLFPAPDLHAIVATRARNKSGTPAGHRRPDGIDHGRARSRGWQNRWRCSPVSRRAESRRRATCRTRGFRGTRRRRGESASVRRARTPAAPCARESVPRRMQDRQRTRRWRAARWQGRRGRCTGSMMLTVPSVDPSSRK